RASRLGQRPGNRACGTLFRWLPPSLSQSLGSFAKGNSFEKMANFGSPAVRFIAPGKARRSGSASHSDYPRYLSDQITERFEIRSIGAPHLVVESALLTLRARGCGGRVPGQSRSEHESVALKCDASARDPCLLPLEIVCSIRALVL